MTSSLCNQPSTYKTWHIPHVTRRISLGTWRYDISPIRFNKNTKSHKKTIFPPWNHIETWDCKILHLLLCDQIDVVKIYHFYHFIYVCHSMWYFNQNICIIETFPNWFIINLIWYSYFILLFRSECHISSLFPEDQKYWKYPMAF